MNEDSTPALTAQAMIAAGHFTVELSSAVIVVYDEHLLPRRRFWNRDRSGSHPFRRVVRRASGIDIVVAAGPGAPVAAITVEFLAALGVSDIVTVGTAGLLNPHRQTADGHFIVERAESDEGTSQHYNGAVNADPGLCRDLAQGLDASTSTVALTTDVPFRHTPERLDAHRQRADVVEMECAATFAVANHFGINAAAVVAISDVFAEHQWSPLNPNSVGTLLQNGIEVAAEVLRKR